jgi:L-lactate permease
MCGGVVSFILTHLPHIIAPLLGLAFLARFALYVRRLPPSHLSDDELAEWHAQRGGRSQARSDSAEQPLPR